MARRAALAGEVQARGRPWRRHRPDREPWRADAVGVGNEALLGGVGTAIVRRSPETLRVGVVVAAAPVMADSWEAGRAVPSERSGTFADGLAVRVAIPHAVVVLNDVATHMLR